MTTPQLTEHQARVLGVLVEKEKTVPDTYPLSLNSLVAGCNQKNNRYPVLELTDGEVQQAVDELKHRLLVIESSGARVPRYSHNVQRVLQVPEQAVALLATLMLRGPQTAAELRINSERLHRFADVSSVEAFLEELATRPDRAGGALVVLLPRQAGERGQRWCQLLSPRPLAQSDQGQASSAQSYSAEEADKVTALEQRLAIVEQTLEQLQRELDAIRGSGSHS